MVFTRKFWKDAAERAAKSVAQAGLLYFAGDQVFDAWHADWRAAGSIAAGAALLSLLSSIASTRVGDSSSASLIQ